jgi:tetratricopeptide (TPR) repeat protein
MFTGQMVTLGYQRSPVDPPELESLFGEMLALPYAWEKAIRPTLIYYQVQRGELEHARREFEGLAARDFTDIVRDEHWLSAMGGCSNAALLLGDRSRAALLYDLLAPYAELFRVHDLLRSVQGSVASRLGELATFLGRHEEAEAHFERAIAKEAAMKARLALMDTKTAYACLLFVRGRTGDRRRAQELLREVESGRLAIGSARVPPELVEARRLAAAPPPSRGRGARS